MTRSLHLQQAAQISASLRSTAVLLSKRLADGTDIAGNYEGITLGHIVTILTLVGHAVAFVEISSVSPLPVLFIDTVKVPSRIAIGASASGALP